jgi:hypothetical protein
MAGMVYYNKRIYIGEFLRRKGNTILTKILTPTPYSTVKYHAERK